MSPPPTPAEVDLDGLAMLLAKASPGPWYAVAYGRAWRVERVPFDPIIEAGSVYEHDAVLIAAAVNALPELLRIARAVKRLGHAKDVRAWYSTSDAGPTALDLADDEIAEARKDLEVLAASLSRPEAR